MAETSLSNSPQNAIEPITHRQADAITQLVWNTKIRTTQVNGETHYSLVDLIAVFAESKNQARVYWKQVKTRLETDGFDAYHLVKRIKLIGTDGRKHATDVGDIITVRRIIMSIPSPKAEPLRMYMAGKTDALLAYRTRNVEGGSEWAADINNQDMRNAGEFDDPELQQPDRWNDIIRGGSHD